MSDSDDDTPRLSSAALTALQEFYSEESRRGAPQTDEFAVGSVDEDWSKSQFWYGEETAERLAEEVAREAGEGGRVACVSTPSVYQKLKQRRADVLPVLLEYDRRFSIYGEEFVFYDYSNPLFLPPEVTAHSFDMVIADPPYLSQECLSKVAVTVRFLTKGKVLLCTGAIMEEDAEKLLGVKMCSFLPKHNRNLANEFRCYVNYSSSLDS
ncbi:EEF1A lysine methyltransferase 1 [Scleropages formosus]|nr:EEF1A lysine methyltransferase 1 [Scleropages formosus]